MNFCKCGNDRSNQEEDGISQRIDEEPEESKPFLRHYAMMEGLADNEIVCDYCFNRMRRAWVMADIAIARV